MKKYRTIAVDTLSNKTEDHALFFFLNDEGVVLVLKKGKFIWKGKEVKDINKIYERFSEWMSKAEMTHPKKEEVG